MKLTARFNAKFDQYAIFRPFQVHTEQLELLEPLERIEIEAINNMRLRKREEGGQHVAEKINRFTLLNDINVRMSSNSKLFTDREYLEKIVKPWMEIFLWFFEVGYYDDLDFQEVLIRVKDNFKLFNEVNFKEFVEWYSRFAIVFIKAALFRLQTKLIKELMKNKSRFKSKLSRFLGDDNLDQQILTFGILQSYRQGAQFLQGLQQGSLPRNGGRDQPPSRDLLQHVFRS